MKTTNEYLDHVKKVNGVTSDYALAKILGCQQNRITSLRKGRVHLNVNECLKISVTGQLDLREVIAAVGIERGDEQTRQAWRTYVKKQLGQALGCVGGLMISSAVALPDLLASTQVILC